MNNVRRAVRGLRLVMLVSALTLSVWVMVVDSQTDGVEFKASPGQIQADALMADCPEADGLPSAVVLIPEGTTEPVRAEGRLVHESLEQIFNNVEFGHVVFGFCR